MQLCKWLNYMLRIKCAVPMIIKIPCLWLIYNHANWVLQLVGMIRILCMAPMMHDRNNEALYPILTTTLSWQIRVQCHELRPPLPIKICATGCYAGTIVPTLAPHVCIWWRSLIQRVRSHVCAMCVWSFFWLWGMWLILRLKSVNLSSKAWQ